MKRKTYIALFLSIFFFLCVLAVFVAADKKFEKSEQTIRLGMELRSAKVQQLEEEKNRIIEELTAVNEDLKRQSVLNHRLQIQADSAALLKDAIIRNQQLLIKKNNEKIDSLTAVIVQFRQSDI